ncbi:unnamed protein product [Protopolystoma xenopodis]|uniref:Ig-like domain-containing protein n=1 Tax=Protopolystoma xenopodis TaxID=117903 RepID=A0A448WFA4_9PLAT|nr:unnamed protein product [Protopolystoma xenopodis]
MWDLTILLVVLPCQSCMAEYLGTFISSQIVHLPESQGLCKWIRGSGPSFLTITTNTTGNYSQVYIPKVDSIEFIPGLYSYLCFNNDTNKTPVTAEFHIYRPPMTLEVEVYSFRQNDESFLITCKPFSSHFPKERFNEERICIIKASWPYHFTCNNQSNLIWEEGPESMPGMHKLYCDIDHILNDSSAPTKYIQMSVKTQIYLDTGFQYNGDWKGIPFIFDYPLLVPRFHHPNVEIIRTDLNKFPCLANFTEAEAYRLLPTEVVCELINCPDSDMIRTYLLEVNNSYNSTFNSQNNSVVISSESVGHYTVRCTITMLTVKYIPVYQHSAVYNFQALKLFISPEKQWEFRYDEQVTCNLMSISRLRSKLSWSLSRLEKVKEVKPVTHTDEDHLDDLKRVDANSSTIHFARPLFFADEVGFPGMFNATCAVYWFHDNKQHEVSFLLTFLPRPNWIFIQPDRVDLQLGELVACLCGHRGSLDAQGDYQLYAQAGATRVFWVSPGKLNSNYSTSELTINENTFQLKEPPQNRLVTFQCVCEALDRENQVILLLQRTFNFYVIFEVPVYLNPDRQCYLPGEPISLSVHDAVKLKAYLALWGNKARLRYSTVTDLNEIDTPKSTHESILSLDYQIVWRNKSSILTGNKIKVKVCQFREKSENAEDDQAGKVYIDFF